MPRMFNKVLDIHGIVAKCHLRFFLRRLEALLEFLRRLRNTHTFSATAKCCLYNDRISDLGCNLCPFYCIINGLCTSRNDRNTSCNHRISCFLLISKLCDDLRIRTDKGNVTLFTQLGKFTVFRQESKTRMNGICTTYDRGTDNAVHTEITLPGRRRSNTDCLVCKLCVKCFFIRFRIYRNRFNSHLSTGPDDAYRDLSPVGN